MSAASIAALVMFTGRDVSALDRPPPRPHDDDPPA
jgi:hypothetical protein